VERHLDVLHRVAHEISPDPEREDRPDSTQEARQCLDALLEELQREAPRTGLGAATGDFVDHVVGVAERYGDHILTCFDHPEIPATTNDLERYFGASKAQLRRALGVASTAGGVALNLGSNYLEAFATTWLLSQDELLELASQSGDTYRDVRSAIEEAERPARLRRSRRRSPGRHLNGLLERWLTDP